MGKQSLSGNSVAVQIDHVPVDGLHPDPGNPRRISGAELEALTRSIQRLGLVDPVIARREDGTVIGGHQRLLAARRLGYTTVPVVYVDLGPEQARLLNVALNKISGEWDQDLLARLLTEFTSDVLTAHPGGWYCSARPPPRGYGLGASDATHHP